MAGTIRHYYAGGNTSRGFYSLFDSVLNGLERLYILKGGPGSGKSTMIRNIGNTMNRRGYDIEMIHCASDNGSIDGVIVTELKLGIVDGTAPHIIEPKAAGAIDEYVNLGISWDSRKLRQQKDRIIALNERIAQSYRDVYRTFEEARSFYNEWKAIYAKQLNTSSLDETAAQLCERIFATKNCSQPANVRRLFFGATTPKGVVDFIPNLTQTMEKRFFLKGRPGTGKSYLLKKLIAEAEARGMDHEVYHSSFDPYDVDMVLFPLLKVAVFDSTPPHEYFPERNDDEIIDLYAIAVTPGTDEKYASHIAKIKKDYTKKMSEGIEKLKQTKLMRDELEALYAEAIDFRIIEQIQHTILKEIDAFTEGQL